MEFKTDDEATESTKLTRRPKDKYTDIGSKTDLRLAKNAGADRKETGVLEKDKILKRLQEISQKHDGKILNNLDIKYLQDLTKSGSSKHPKQPQQPNSSQSSGSSTPTSGPPPSTAQQKQASPNPKQQ